MKQSLSVITLGVVDLVRSKRFYAEGFGWASVFENEDIIFFQMNGFVLGTFRKQTLDEDMNRIGSTASGAYALAHNVAERDGVEPAMEQLLAAGGTLLRAADSPPHGGFRGYVADPDGHAWEIAWNPQWPIDAAGHVRFGL
jgi:catechol 2,3-dioxygenase-like lactoylglutathione lyase family enzyme